MPWLRMDDGFTTHPKVLGLSLPAKVLWMYSLGYSAHELTDGVIITKVLPGLAGLAGVPNVAEVAEEILASGLWESDPQGYRVHDYLKYNPSRADVLAEREKAKTRMMLARSSPEHRKNLIDPVPGPGPVPGPIEETAGADAPVATPRKRKPKTVPSERKPPANAEQFSALAVIEGLDPHGPIPKDKRGQLNGYASDCASQKWTARAIEKISELWGIEHPDGPPCTAHVVVMNGARLLRNPPKGPAIKANGRTNGKAPNPWPAFEPPTRTGKVLADGTILDADGKVVGFDDYIGREEVMRSLGNAGN